MLIIQIKQTEFEKESNYEYNKMQMLEIIFVIKKHMIVCVFVDSSRESGIYLHR